MSQPIPVDVQLLRSVFPSKDDAKLQQWVKVLHDEEVETVQDAAELLKDSSGETTCPWDALSLPLAVKTTLKEHFKKLLAENGAQKNPAPKTEDAPPPPAGSFNTGPQTKSTSKTIDWDQIHARLPTSRKPEDKKRRMDLFMQFDPNSNGYLSLAEVDMGCKNILRLYELFDCKPVIMRAFMAAKSANNKNNKTKHDKHGPDYIEKCEFRLLLVYLRQYFELWQMFSEIDDSGDRRVELDEFKKALPKLESWGVKIDDPQAAFNEIDTNGGGIILFDEFSHWALEKGLDLEDDDDFDDPALHGVLEKK